VPLASRSELDHGQVPGDHHRHGPPLAGPQGEPHGDRARERLAAAHPGQVVVRQPAVPGERSPDRGAVAGGIEGGLVGDLRTRRVHRRDRKLPVPLVAHVPEALAVEDDALHGRRSRARGGGAFESVEVAFVEGVVEVAGVGAEGPDHVGPGEQDRHGHRARGGVLGVPAVDRDGIAALLVVVGENRRELLEHHVGREPAPSVVVPGLRIESVVVAGAHGIVPLPSLELAVPRMVGQQGLSDALGVTLGSLVHGELVRGHRLVLVDAGLDVPAGEVSAIGAGERAGSEPPDGRALPVAVVDVARALGRRASARVGERLADGTLPGHLGDGVSSGRCARRGDQRAGEDDRQGRGDGGLAHGSPLWLQQRSAGGR
jgi:hypothetical protein